MLPETPMLRMLPENLAQMCPGLRVFSFQTVPSPFTPWRGMHIFVAVHLSSPLLPWVAPSLLSRAAVPACYLAFLPSVAPITPMPISLQTLLPFVLCMDRGSSGRCLSHWGSCGNNRHQLVCTAVYLASALPESQAGTSIPSFQVRKARLREARRLARHSAGGGRGRTLGTVLEEVL